MPQGESQHDSPGGSYVRVGGSKYRMTSDERLRLAQRRAQSRYLWFDKQIVPQTGFETLNERLWEPLLSVAGAADPRRALMNLRLLATDEGDVDRATVAGVLLCANRPEEWLPQATISATCYRGKDRALWPVGRTGNWRPALRPDRRRDEFCGPATCALRRTRPLFEKMRRSTARPRCLEAVVNAVVHRDYSIASRRIRLSMFKDRLEIDSPGQLPNGMTIESMNLSQATRNETLASVFARIPVSEVPGSRHRQYMMERRGDGVSIILKETRETAGVAPEYRVVDQSSLVLSIPAAKLELTPSDATVTAHSEGEPLAGVDVLVLFPNKTWRRATTDESGEAHFDLYATHLPMTVYAAMSGYAAGLAREWTPREGGLLLELAPLPDGGAAIFPKSTGNVPGLHGRLNPDTRYL